MTINVLMFHRGTEYSEEKLKVGYDNLFKKPGISLINTTEHVKKDDYNIFELKKSGYKDVSSVFKNFNKPESNKHYISFYSFIPEIKLFLYTLSHMKNQFNINVDMLLLPHYSLNEFIEELENHLQYHSENLLLKQYKVNCKSIKSLKENNNNRLHVELYFYILDYYTKRAKTIKVKLNIHREECFI